MIIGENAKPDDLEVNPMKSKQLTNFRSTGKDDAIRLTPPWRMTLEQAIAYVDDDEMVEVTPKNIRLRKRFLDPNERKKQAEPSRQPKKKGAGFPTPFPCDPKAFCLEAERCREPDIVHVEIAVATAHVGAGRVDERNGLVAGAVPGPTVTR